MKTTRILTLPLFILGSSMLTACGGGSGDDDAASSGGAAGSNSTMLSALVVQDTNCGTQIPVTSAELVVYNNNWKITSRHKANAQGKISASIPATNSINYSLIRSSGSGDKKRILVDTFAQHPVGDLGIFKVSNTSSQGCECVTTNVRLISEPNSMSYNIQLTGHIEGTDYMDPPGSSFKVTFSNRQICRQPNGSWPVLTAMANGGYRALAGEVTNYDPSRAIDINMDLVPQLESISLNGDAQQASYFYQTSKGALSGAQEYPYDIAVLFTDMKAKATFSIRSSSTASSNIGNLPVTLGRSQRRGYELPLAENLELTLPDTNAHQELITTLRDSVLSEKTNYDLSRVSNFNTFYTGIVMTLTDGSQLDWFFIGPKTGYFPEDPMPADYKIDNLIDENSYFYVSMGMQRYGENQTYQQYVSDYQERGRLPQHERLVGKWREFNHVYVGFQR